MEIVVRAAVIYLFLWLVTRVVGKRTLGELTSFELVLLVVMGDLIQQGVTQEDYSVTGALLAVSTFALLIVLVSWVSFRFPRTRTLIEGPPVVVVHDGRVLDDVMHVERLSISELLEGLREHGIEDVRDVRMGVLEPDGKLSFFLRDGARST